MDSERLGCKLCSDRIILAPAKVLMSAIQYSKPNDHQVIANSFAAPRLIPDKPVPLPAWRGTYAKVAHKGAR